MSRTALGLGVLAVLLVAGCAQDQWHSRDVGVQFGFRPEVPELPILNPRLDIRPRVSPLVRDIVQGEPVPVSFTITNTGKDPIILLRLEASQVPAPLHTWTQPVYGRLEYDRNTETYSFFPDAKLRSPHTFYNGFLFPGEKRTFSVKLHFRDSGKVRQNFSLIYYRKTPELLREEIYVHQADPLAASLRYVRPGMAEPEEWKKASGRFESIIFRGTGGEKIFSFGRDFKVRPVYYSYDKALEKAGFEPDDYDYSPWKQGWVLEKDGDLTVVTPAAIERYKGVSLEVFKFIESHKGYYLPVMRMAVKLREGSVPFHIWDEDVYVSVRDLFATYSPKDERGHRIDVPVGDVFALIGMLKAQGFRTFHTTFDDEPVLGLEAETKHRAPAPETQAE